MQKLKGVSIGSGVVSGRPVIVKHEDDLKNIQIGDVLVAKTTDVRFTPAFLKASAIVTEVGGRFCHAANWAREHNLIAIIQVPGAIKHLSGVDFVIVNAIEGVITWKE